MKKMILFVWMIVFEICFVFAQAIILDFTILINTHRFKRKTMQKRERVDREKVLAENA